MVGRVLLCLVLAAAPAFADLALAMADAPDPTVVGAPLTHQLTVTNAGPATATNVMLTQSLPVGAAFVSATASQGSCSAATSLTCAVGSLASGGASSSRVGPGERQTSFPQGLRSRKPWVPMSDLSR